MRKLILLFVILICISTSSSAEANSSLAQQRAAHLRHGINLSEWFAQVYDPKGYTKEHFENWTTPTTLRSSSPWASIMFA
jgi:hypothetical protein